MDGICTLANDYVYDQVIALINSIEAIAGKDVPVCIYPYDDNTERLAAEVERRSNVTLYSDRDSLDKWDRFAREAWDTHPTARQIWQRSGSNDYHRFGTHRRYCAFDNPFDRFLYMDADTLLMNSVEFIFKALNNNDCVVYDFQHKDLTHVYNNNSPQLKKVFNRKRLKTEIFCSGFYASKKDLFDLESRQSLLSNLTKEADILYPMAPDQTLINYMMMRSGQKINNLALSLPKEKTTGCCVTSEHFTIKDNLLYDRNNRLTYIHYIGLSSRLFARLCQGENIDFPYRDLFLYYRYLHEPEKRPQFTTKGQPFKKHTSLTERVMRKFGLKA